MSTDNEHVRDPRLADRPPARRTGSRAPPEVTVDREEITVVGTLAAPDHRRRTPPRPSGPPRRRPRSRSSASETREQRIEIARELEHRTGRKVAWGVQVRRAARAVHDACPCR